MQKGRRKQHQVGRNPKSWTSSHTYKWHALRDYIHTICLFGSTNGFSNQVVSKFFPCILIYSQFLFHRVNLLTKLLSVCTYQQTSAMPSTKLLNVTEGLNMSVWLLTGSGFTASRSRKWQFKNTTSQTVTQSWGTISLCLKIPLKISLAPFASV